VAVIVVMGLLALFVLTDATLLRDGFLARLARWLAVPEAAWWLSPFAVAAGVVLLFFATPPAWAYWLVRDNPQGDGLPRAIGKWLAPVAGAAASGWLLLRPGDFVGAGTLAQSALWVVLAVTVTTMARFGYEWLVARGRPHKQRRNLTRGLMRALVIAGVLLSVGIIDALGLWIAMLPDLRGPGFTATMLGIGVALRKQLLMLVSRVTARERPALPAGILLNVAAFTLVIAFLGVIASIPHYVVRNTRGEAASLMWLAGITGALVMASSRVWSFVNRSSLHAMYEARLRRAYLGASNPKRVAEGQDHPPVTDPDQGDGMSLAEYDPSREGGPIHLINVTINETVDGRSQVQQRDRKGVGMAIGPAGVSVGITHHALWDDQPATGMLGRLAEGGRHLLNYVRQGMQGIGVRAADLWRRTDEPPRAKPTKPFRVFPDVARPEVLDVGQWIAVSGGAVSTGLGARTNLALSLLVGFFNVRLGYWWKSGVTPMEREGATRRSLLQTTLAALRRVVPVQSALLDEWLARFPGVARPEWYLTDGGHFENLGAYELLRRRMPFIVVCDNEQDGDYEFEGLGNLVRKARTDLDAEITFLPEAELRDGAQPPFPQCFGSPDALRRGRRTREPIVDSHTGMERLVTESARTGLSLRHAALARITYHSRHSDPTEGWLVYVKPSLTGNEPIDVQQYHTAHPDFPHESTADQFFGEAQWESYRKLGEHMALELFGDPNEWFDLHLAMARGPLEGAMSPGELPGIGNLPAIEKAATTGGGHARH
jgi:hypothetical protein